MDVVLHLFWMWPGVGCCWGGRPPRAVVGPVAVASRPSRLGPVAGCEGEGVRWVWLPVLSCCGPLVAVVGGLVACSGRGPRGCRPPFLLARVCGSVPLPAALAVSAAPWLMVSPFPGGGPVSACPGWSLFLPLWSAFAGGGLSPGWAGWSAGFLALGPVGAARGLAWPGSCLPCWGVFLASRVFRCRCCCS